MIGITLEKLVLVLVIVGLVLGPSRLPAAAAWIGEAARRLRAFVDAARARAEADLGMPVRPDAWQREARRYDPRRIVRDALVAEQPSAADADGAPPVVDREVVDAPDLLEREGRAASCGDPLGADGPMPAAAVPHGGATSDGTAVVREGAAVQQQASSGSEPIATRTRWIVAGGSSGHPRRIRIVEPIPPEEPERVDAPAA